MPAKSLFGLRFVSVDLLPRANITAFALWSDIPHYRVRSIANIGENLVSMA
jgi:hypothetical protein